LHEEVFFLLFRFSYNYSQTFSLSTFPETWQKTVIIGKKRKQERTRSHAAGFWLM